jgi:DNA-binding NarL/FixJ family response regulator
MTTRTKPKVLLADDHQIVLDGLARLLADDFELVGTVTNGRDLVRAAAERAPDVIVVDVSMPLLNGIDAIRQMRANGNTSKIVCLSMHPEVEYASRALEAGAGGYVLKHSASDELVAAIREILRGGTYISTALRTPGFEELLARGSARHKTTLSLTPRQREIVQLLAEGKSAKEIGALLDISSRTVESHKYKIMEDLGLKTSAQLVQYAIGQGLVTPP